MTCQSTALPLTHFGPSYFRPPANATGKTEATFVFLIWRGKERDGGGEVRDGGGRREMEGEE